MSTPAWAPPRVPDVSDPAFSAFSVNAGVVVAPTGITSAEAFGSAAVAISFNGDFSQFGATPTLYLQPDRTSGLSEFATLKDGGGTGPVLTFTGTRSGPSVPIWVKCTLGGALGVWTYAIYYDGTGTTPAMTGTSASTVVLTGAGAGLTLNIAAGTATLNNIWKAVGLPVDLSGAGSVFTQAATVVSCPDIVFGLNGKVCLQADGTNHFAINNSINLPAPGTTPCFCYTIVQLVALPGSTGVMFSGGTAGCSVQALSTGGLFQFDGTTANTNTGALPVGTWGRLLTRFNAATTDFNQWGSAAAVTGTSAGNTDPASQYSFFSSVGGGSKLNLRMHLHLVFPYIPSGGQLASLDASAISYFGITI